MTFMKVLTDANIWWIYYISPEIFYSIITFKRSWVENAIKMNKGALSTDLPGAQYIIHAEWLL